MTIIISISAYLFVSLIVYLWLGEFYLTYYFKQTNVRVNNMSIDQLDISKDKIRKGVYAGTADYKNQKCYFFQFNNIFKDEARMLNVYFRVDKGGASFLETDEKISGEDAFFIIQKGEWTSGRYENDYPTGIIFNEYYMDSKLPNPETFLKKTGGNASIGNSLFVLALNINTDYELEVKMIKFVKNNYGFYGLIRKKAELSKNDWQLKDTSVNKGQVYKGLFMNILLAIADVITGGLQLIGHLLFQAFSFLAYIFSVLIGGVFK